MPSVKKENTGNNKTAWSTKRGNAISLYLWQSKDT